MGKKKRLECAVCGAKMDFPYTSVLLSGKVRKVCSEACFRKAVDYGKENSNKCSGVNRSIASYRVRE